MDFFRDSDGHIVTHSTGEIIDASGEGCTCCPEEEHDCLSFCTSTEVGHFEGEGDDAVWVVDVPSKPCCHSDKSRAVFDVAPELRTDTGDALIDAAAIVFNAMGTTIGPYDNGFWQGYSEPFEHEGEQFRLHRFVFCTYFKTDIYQWNGADWAHRSVLTQTSFVYFPAGVPNPVVFDCCRWDWERYWQHTIAQRDFPMSIKLENNKCCRVEDPGYPTWSSGTTYAAGDRVKHGTDWFESLQDDNLGHAPTSGGGWWTNLNIPICQQSATDNCPSVEECPWEEEEDI